MVFFIEVPILIARALWPSAAHYADTRLASAVISKQ